MHKAFPLWLRDADALEALLTWIVNSDGSLPVSASNRALPAFHVRSHSNWRLRPKRLHSQVLASLASACTGEYACRRGHEPCVDVFVR